MKESAMVHARARATDPWTSHEAADQVERSGTAKSQRAQCLVAVEPGISITAAEVAKKLGVERHMPSRRLPELREAGLVRNGPERKCLVLKRTTMTWERAPKPGDLFL